MDGRGSRAHARSPVGGRVGCDVDLRETRPQPAQQSVVQPRFGVADRVDDKRHSGAGDVKEDRWLQRLQLRVWLVVVEIEDVSVQVLYGELP